MTIHTSHPFAENERVLGRQLRGRLGNRVSLWCAGQLDDWPAGLTVSSVLVVPGEPWRVVGFIDPTSELASTLEETGRATVTLLEWADRAIADMFGGLTPAPRGPFKHAEFRQTEYGPVLAGAQTWAGVELEDVTEVGWMQQVTCRAVDITIGADDTPLHHVRGRYAQITRS